MCKSILKGQNVPGTDGTYHGTDGTCPRDRRDAHRRDAHQGVSRQNSLCLLVFFFPKLFCIICTKLAENVWKYALQPAPVRRLNFPGFYITGQSYKWGHNAPRSKTLRRWPLGNHFLGTLRKLFLRGHPKEVMESPMESNSFSFGGGCVRFLLPWSARRSWASAAAAATAATVWWIAWLHSSAASSTAATAESIASCKLCLLCRNTSEVAYFRKIRAPIKIKSALPPPPPKTPHKRRNFMDIGFPAERRHFFQVSIKLAQPFPAPELRTRILRTRGFFWLSQSVR